MNLIPELLQGMGSAPEDFDSERDVQTGISEEASERLPQARILRERMIVTEEFNPS